MPDAPTTAPAHTNALADETSPYLLQHAHNPVDWRPWGAGRPSTEARRRGVPVFLSVGYSTCYWCHVMERESFESEATAAVMNERYVCVKVDREERPDVDALYMTAVQILTRQGGWPMSVFLLPDGRPFYGGTYFPPADAHGRPSFTRVLTALSDAHRDERDNVEANAAEITRVLRRLADPRPPEAAVAVDEAFLANAARHSAADYEPRFGGFGSAPKFPRETLLEMLLVAAGDEPQIAKQLRHTLDAMADGGLRDHLGGGFHRYSTDARWLVPHFEIMLYDQAMLAWVYAEASRQYGVDRYARVARGVLDFVLREMTSPEGAFYTAFDAEVDAREGLNYLWTPEQVAEVLGDADAARFGKVYGLDRGPNFADPHHGDGTPMANILHLPDGPGDDEDDPAVAAMRAKLLAARATRKQPLLDTKVVTSWNALNVRALAFAGRVLGEPRYTEAAARAADFLLTKHRTDDGGLSRTSRDGVQRHAGFLDDYAFLAHACLELHATTGDDRWRREATGLADLIAERFNGDPGDNAATGGFYFTDAGQTDLIVRQKVATDSPLPSGNAVAARVFLALGRAGVAHGVVEAFAGTLEGNPAGESSLVTAAAELVRARGPFVVEPPSEGGDAATRPASPDQLAESAVALRGEWLAPDRLAVTLHVAAGHHVNGADAPAPLVAARPDGRLARRRGRRLPADDAHARRCPTSRRRARTRGRSRSSCGSPGRWATRRRSRWRCVTRRVPTRRASRR